MNIIFRPYGRAAGIAALALFAGVFLTSSSLDRRSRDFAPYTETLPGSEEGIAMTPIEGGTFSMSASGAGESHRVQVDDFWMGTHEITWQQYDAFTSEVVSQLQSHLPYEGEDGEVALSADAIALPTQPYVDMSFGMGRDGYPAISMTHYAAVMFTKWLTAKTGTFYRLPTEAEWAYACSAGSDAPHSTAEAAGPLSDYEWHSENSEGSYNQVGKKAPNPFGLYDMRGNVAEWTMDQYFEDYHERLGGDPAVNPWFKPTELYPRAVRGGSWQDPPEEARCAKRRGSQADWKKRDPQFPKSLWWHTNAQFLGFRIVRPRKTPSPEERQAYWIEAMKDF